jgi:hypothetical protein
MAAAPTENSHLLLQPRVLAAVGLAALGTGLGVGLMIAKTMIFVGLLISLSSAVAILWLYWSDFFNAFNSLRTRTVYTGLRVAELAIPLGVIIVIVPISLSVYFAVSQEEPIKNKPNITLERYNPDPATFIRLALTIANTGSMPAHDFQGILAGEVLDKLLDEAALSAIFSKLDVLINQLDNNTAKQHKPSLDVGHPEVIHAYDVNKINVLSDFEAARVNDNLLHLSVTDWPRVLAGNRVLYMFLFIRYIDDNIDGHAYWQQYICAFYTGAEPYYHRCADGEPQIVRKRRYR